MPLLGSVAGIPFPFCDYGLQQSIGSTPRKPPHFLFLPQLLSLCWEHLQAAKTTVVRARREQTGILPSPGSQHVALGSHLGRGSPQGGDPTSPRGEGGRGSTTHLPPAFPVAPGSHSSTPCCGFSSGGLGCGRSQAFPDSSLCRVLLLLPCLYLPWLCLNLSLHLAGFMCLLCFTGQITQGNGIDFAWAARKEIFFNFN